MRPLGKRQATGHEETEKFPLDLKREILESFTNEDFPFIYNDPEDPDPRSIQEDPELINKIRQLGWTTEKLENAFQDLYDGIQDYRGRNLFDEFVRCYFPILMKQYERAVTERVKKILRGELDIPEDQNIFILGPLETMDPSQIGNYVIMNKIIYEIDQAIKCNEKNLEVSLGNEIPNLQKKKLRIKTDFEKTFKQEYILEITSRSSPDEFTHILKCKMRDIHKQITLNAYNEDVLQNLEKHCIETYVMYKDSDLSEPVVFDALCIICCSLEILKDIDEFTKTCISKMSPDKVREFTEKVKQLTASAKTKDSNYLAILLKTIINNTLVFTSTPGYRKIISVYQSLMSNDELQNRLARVYSMISQSKRTEFSQDIFQTLRMNVSIQAPTSGRLLSVLKKINSLVDALYIHAISTPY